MKLDFEQRERATQLEQEMESGDLGTFAHELIWLRDLLTGSTIRKPDGWAYRYRHRYILRRSWMGDGGTVNFIMLNPSTADDVFDDATIRRCIGFAKRWGYSGIVVTNLFAYRATQPKDLMTLVGQNVGLAIGDDNAAHLGREARAAKLIVCAWGDNCDILPHRDLDVIATLRDYDLYCIRKTKKGNPAHPVREPYVNAPQILYSKVSTEIECARLPRRETIHLRAANEAEPEGIEGTGETCDE